MKINLNKFEDLSNSKNYNKALSLKEASWNKEFKEYVQSCKDSSRRDYLAAIKPYKDFVNVFTEFNDFMDEYTEDKWKSVALMASSEKQEECTSVKKQKKLLQKITKPLIKLTILATKLDKSFNLHREIAEEQSKGSKEASEFFKDKIPSIDKIINLIVGELKDVIKCIDKVGYKKSSTFVDRLIYNSEEAFPEQIKDLVYGLDKIGDIVREISECLGIPHTKEELKIIEEHVPEAILLDSKKIENTGSSISKRIEFLESYTDDLKGKSISILDHEVSELLRLNFLLEELSRIETPLSERIGANGNVAEVNDSILDDVIEREGRLNNEINKLSYEVLKNKDVDSINRVLEGFELSVEFENFIKEYFKKINEFKNSVKTKVLQPSIPEDVVSKVNCLAASFELDSSKEPFTLVKCNQDFAILSNRIASVYTSVNNDCYVAEQIIYNNPKIILSNKLSYDFEDLLSKISKVHKIAAEIGFELLAKEYRGDTIESTAAKFRKVLENHWQYPELVESLCENVEVDDANAILAVLHFVAVSDKDSLVSKVKEFFLDVSEDSIIHAKNVLLDNEILTNYKGKIVFNENKVGKNSVAVTENPIIQTVAPIASIVASQNIEENYLQYPELLETLCKDIEVDEANAILAVLNSVAIRHEDALVSKVKEFFSEVSEANIKYAEKILLHHEILTSYKGKILFNESMVGKDNVTGNPTIQKVSLIAGIIASQEIEDRTAFSYLVG